MGVAPQARGPRTRLSQAPQFQRGATQVLAAQQFAAQQVPELRERLVEAILMLYQGPRGGMWSHLEPYESLVLSVASVLMDTSLGADFEREFSTRLRAILAKSFTSVAFQIPGTVTPEKAFEICVESITNAYNSGTADLSELARNLRANVSELASRFAQLVQGFCRWVVARAAAAVLDDLFGVVRDVVLR